MVADSARRRSSAAKRSLITVGARPSDGSSSRRSLGRAISPRATASICCSPPESSPARWCSRSRRRGKRSSIAAMSLPISPLRPLLRVYAPSSRLCSTESSGNTCLPSGTSARPRGAILCAGSRATSSPPKAMPPATGRSSPAIARMSVDLPAPFAPSTATTSRSRTSRSTPFSTGSAP